MPSALHTNPSRPPAPPKTRAVFPSWAILFLAIMVSGIIGSVAAADQRGDDPVHRFNLAPDISVDVESDGALVFLSADSPTPLLQAGPVTLTDSRRRRGHDTFNLVVADGAEGGHRGFSARADDDQDGLTDEDPLDGIDNDGDGKTDEDFAAVSDAMVAFQLGEPGNSAGDLHLEYYHWATPRLSSAVFLNAGRGRGTYRLTSSGSVWRETGIKSMRHTVTGRPEQENSVAIVCRVSPAEGSYDREPCAPGSGWWLGVTALDDNTSSRFVMDRDQLDLALDDNQVPLAICVADSWLQLNRILAEARRVYEGMTDPVDNRRARWIVPPACSACREASPPGFAVETDPEGDFTLIAEITPGQCGLLDPDLFQVGNRSLGAPREIRWMPEEGPEVVVPWSCLTADGLQTGSSAAPDLRSALTGLDDHQARGRLMFVFTTKSGALDENFIDAAKADVKVVGRYLNGRSVQTNLTTVPEDEPEVRESPASSLEPAPETVEEATRRYAEDRSRILQSERRQPSLSPTLLKGWPNPFSDVISIRFTVPRSMKEAFIWKDKNDQPAEIDLEGDVPWSGGQPGVSVKIYSINGQELVTLHSASQGVGEYTVQWNGTDAFGRKVASGTYFCKLQMDDWSVTRRLVFIR